MVYFSQSKCYKSDIPYSTTLVFGRVIYTIIPISIRDTCIHECVQPAVQLLLFGARSRDCLYNDWGITLYRCLADVETPYPVRTKHDNGQSTI
jgi:hypothetical protein